MPPAISETTRKALLRTLGADRLRRDVVLAPMTTFQIGGPADLFFEATSAAELRRAIEAARKLDIPYFLLGLGANILVGDRGFRGLVIRNRAQQVSVNQETTHLYAESGAIIWRDVIETAVAAGLSGLEHYAGIPSTVGGALWQNLHFLSPPPARERTMYIEEVLLEAELLTEENEHNTVGVEYFNFGYDQSILHERDDVVLSATFQLEPADIDWMRNTISANLAWRSERHPPLDTEPSAGSIFQKIDGIGAGRLIDECGLLGTRMGRAEVTHRHANIIVNRGGATAADVRALIQHVQDTVARETGYHLETEIAMIGDFAPPTSSPPYQVPKPEGIITAKERAQRGKEQRDVTVGKK